MPRFAHVHAGQAPTERLTSLPGMCIGPVKICSSYKGDGSDECDDGRQHQTVAKRKTALVVEIIQGKTTVAEASRAYDLSPSEIEGWVDDARRGMEMPCGRTHWRQGQAHSAQVT